MNKNISIAVFDSKQYDIQFFTDANKKFLYNIDFFEPRLNEQTASLAEGHSVVCAFVNDKLNKAVINKLSSLGVKLIAMRCAGFNNIDLKASKDKIKIVRVPSYSPHSVAEYSFALLMALTRKIVQAFNRTRDGNFRLEGLTGRDLFGKKAGIIGTGKIGKIMAELLNAFGMEVCAFDLFPDNLWADKAGIKYVQSVDDIYKTADVISLHCPLTPETHHIVSEKSFSLMKNDCVIINTGRGALIDTRSLVEALKDQKIGGAALDVYEEEDEYFFEDWSSTVIKDDTLARLLMMPNVIVSSHQAFLTQEALTAIAETTLENCKAFFEGGELINEVSIK